MAVEVQRGEFLKAAKLGNSASIPLGVAKADLHISDTLYNGQQGSVLRGMFQNEDVAVKKARISTAQDLDNFRKEVSLMSRVAHPNVVRLLAAHVLPPEYMLVMPMEGDNLATKLHQQGWRPNWREVIRLSLNLASAVAAIHKAGILHRDIKASNVLLGNDGSAILGDFGIAELAAVLAEEQADRTNLIRGGKPSGGFHKRHLVGTLEYMAPEVLLKEPTTFASDVYAWAVTVNELATGVFPFADCTKDNPQCQTILNFGYGRQELAAAVAAEGLRPILAPDTPRELAALLEAAWQLQPAARPSAEHLEAELRALLHSMDSAPSASPSDCDGAANGNGHSVHTKGSADAGVPPGQRDAYALTNGVANEVPVDLDGDWGRPPWEKAESSSSSSFQAKVTAGAFETAGLRGEDRMEDFHFIASPLPGAGPSTYLIGIFDGHRGREAAAYAAQHFPHFLRREWHRDSAEAALQAAFLEIDAAFRRQQDEEWAERVGRMGWAAAGERPWPGCTAIVLLMHAGRLYVANAGDCRAVLCREGDAVALSTDQTAEREDERQRIISAGGHVQYRMDSWRVGKAGIQVSRSIGDADLKSEGLTAEPEVTARALDEGDLFVVAASDGFWDKVDNTEAVNMVHDTVKEPSMSAKRLATEALTRGSADNITVIVAFLQPVSTLEQIYANGRQKYAAHQMFVSPNRAVKPSYVQPASADEFRDTY
ncbi:g7880 [Coccomyxa elongata]